MPPQPTHALALNAGSSSLKFSLWRVVEGEEEHEVYSGSVSNIGEGAGTAKFSVPGSKTHLTILTISDACAVVFDWIGAQQQQPVDVVGHRVVHGGDIHRPQLINQELIEVLNKLSKFAPEHLPPVLECISLAKAAFPGVPHCAAFDTAFHSAMPLVASTYSMPEVYRKNGLRKYGFHGLSYEYLLSSLMEELGEEHVRGLKLVFLHLGHGASLAAVSNAAAVDTTMGFSPCGGFPMSTRLGDIDPEAILFLLDNESVPAGELKVLLNKKCGLRAFSDKGGDFRELEKAASALDPAAAFALDYFVYHLCKHIAAMVSALGGLDCLVFTAGVGENSCLVRERVCQRLAYLGVELDVEGNKATSSAPRVISDAHSRVVVRVMPTNEEVVIARASVAVAKAIIA